MRCDQKFQRKRRTKDRLYITGSLLQVSDKPDTVVLAEYHHDGYHVFTAEIMTLRHWFARFSQLKKLVLSLNFYLHSYESCDWLFYITVELEARPLKSLFSKQTSVVTKYTRSFSLFATQFFFKSVFTLVVEYSAKLKQKTSSVVCSGQFYPKV